VFLTLTDVLLALCILHAHNRNAALSSELQQTRASLEAAEGSNKLLTKTRDLLVAQLKNSKEVSFDTY